MSWQSTFDRAAEHIDHRSGDGEDWTLWVEAENTHFARLNQASVRQAGEVRRMVGELRWVKGRRHARVEVTLGSAEDLARIDAAIVSLRQMVAAVPEDPYLLLDREGAQSSTEHANELPDPGEVLELVLDGARTRSLDLVGILASGGICRGFASSWGHRHWFSTHAWQLDMSSVVGADKADKRTFGGRSWDPAQVNRELDGAARVVKLLARPAVTVDPGKYRAWFTPAAMSELMGLIAWGHTGARSLATKASALTRLEAGTVQFDPRVRFSEKIAGSTSPAFQSAGFQRPDEVALVDEGRLVGRLVSPRSAQEYDLEPNGASASEMMEAISMAPGQLPTKEALQRLGTGVWVSNLWYTNWSDVNAARLTGMTRFATLWVEDGVPVAPLSVMRFDDSLFDLLGSKLVGIGDTVEFMASTSTYGFRSTDSMSLPGALVEDFAFTL